MDQIDKMNVEKLYEEFVQYDPSLAKDKDALLQVIKKMLAAKPEIEVNAQWKESFGEQLQEYVMSKKAAAPAKSALSSWLAKRSLSFASLRLALLVVGASYYRWQIEVKPKQKAPASQNKANLAMNTTDANGGTWGEILSDGLGSDIQDNDADNIAQPATALVEIAPPTAGDAAAEVRVAYDNGAVNADATARVEFSDDKTIGLRASWTDEMSTEVDIATTSIMKETPRDELLGGVRGGIWGWIDPEMWSDVAAVPATTAMIAPDEMSNTSVLSAETKEIALVITDKQGVLFDTPALEIVTQYGISITIIPYNTAQAEKLKKQWFAITDFLISGSQWGVVYIDASEVRINPDSLRGLIEKHQADGYAFIEISATQ